MASVAREPPNAGQRLMGLKRRLEKDPELKEKYVTAIEGYIEQEHAEPAEGTGVQRRT